VDRSALRGVLSRDLARDAAVVLGWFVAAAVVGAVVWWQVTPLAEFTRTTSDAQMGEEQLGQQVASDGWFFAIAAAGGLLSGVALLGLRRRDPLAMVVLVTLGAGLASWLMLLLGHWLGPPAPAGALHHVAVGDTVPVQLETHTFGVMLMWPIAALVGTVGVLFGLDDPARRRGDTGSTAATSGNDRFPTPSSG
jgi:hypothetical protein